MKTRVCSFFPRNCHFATCKIWFFTVNSWGDLGGCISFLWLYGKTKVNPFWGKLLLNLNEDRWFPCPTNTFAGDSKQHPIISSTTDCPCLFSCSDLAEKQTTLPPYFDRRHWAVSYEKTKHCPLIDKLMMKLIQLDRAGSDLLTCTIRKKWDSHGHSVTNTLSAEYENT